MKIRFKKLPGDRVLLAILIVLSAFAARPLLWQGLPRTGDVWAHFARIKVVYDALIHFKIPYWDFGIYYGYPFLKFYAPLYYYLSAVFVFITGGNLVFGTKLLLFVCHIMSAVTMFFFVRKFLKDSGAAFIASLAYAFAFWHLFHIIWMSRYPVALIYVLVPLCFLNVLRYVENQTISRAIFTGLSFGLALLVHPQFGIFTILFSLLFALPYINGLKVKIFLWSAVSLLALSGFSILPFIIEGRRFLNPFSIERYVNVSLPAILEWANGINRHGSWYKGEYIGLSITFMALLGLFKATKDNQKLRLPMYFGILLCFLFTFGLAIPGFKWFYQLFGMIPKRFLVFLVIFLSIYAANGYLLLTKYFKRALIPLIIVALIIIIDLAPTTFKWDPWPSSQVVLEGRDQVYAIIKPGLFLADLATADTGSFEFGRIAMFPGTQTMYSDNPSPYGYYFQFAPKTILYSYQWLNMLAQGQKADSTDSIVFMNSKICQLLNIYYITYENEEHKIMLKRFPDIMPIIVSGKISPWQNSETVIVGQYCYAGDYKQLFDSTKIDLKMASAEKLWILGGQAKSLDGYIPAKPNATQFDLHQNTAHITVEAQSPCFARLPLSYYPDIKIYINGVRCPKVYESADHFMIVQLDKGVSRIDIIPCRSIVEKVSLAISGICLFAVAGILFWERKARKRSSNIN
jgi:hypothetical protein